MKYTELHAHSAFSFGAGTMGPEALVSRAAELGYPALALADTADLGGAIRFTLEAERVNVKPVVGAELLIDGHPTVFLAQNQAGYRNLATLVTKARMGAIDRWQLKESPRALAPTPARPEATSAAPLNRERGHDLQKRYAIPLPPRGQPRLTFSDLAEHSEGLFCLTGPAAGEVATHVRTGRATEAVFLLERWRNVFGSRLAVEVQMHHAGGHNAALATALIELAERSRIRWVITNEPYYRDGASRLVHDLLVANRAEMCVNTAASFGLLLPNGEWRLKSPREIAKFWEGREAGLEQSCAIADECQPFDLHWLRPPLPNFPTPVGHTDDSWLRTIVFEGAETRWGEIDERQRTQIEHELGVIQRLGFAGFFLVMWDAVFYARNRGILCQGRGSAANSAVAYCLGITAVDPVKHGLLFERFLSEVRTDGRTEAPDINVDFEMHRREEVLDYMYDNYKRQHSAITCVTQMYHAPTAIQDMMRALGYTAELAFTCSKRVHGLEPSEGAELLRAGLAKEAGLNLEDPKGRALLAALEALDDVPRLRSTHPGGFVLSCEPLGNYLPIEHTTMGRTIIQFDKDDLDAAGVPKFDFLGLGGLSAIHLAFDAIEQRTGEQLTLYKLPVDDEPTYQMIARGDTVGTFQIESRAQIQSILQTKPDRLYDIVVQVALIRPGPIQAKFVHPYTERRCGREPVTYAHPALEPILRRTQGVPIFQEQAMAIAMALGGFSAAEADELRRAMGHRRKLARLHAALEKLKLACVSRGVRPEVAEQVVEDLHSFANYGFPESHAWSFALIAYATAWLKANYPTEFFLGMLNAWPMGFYPPATLVHDAIRHGVVVLGPCMRVGEWDCTLELQVEGEVEVGVEGSVAGAGRVDGVVEGRDQDEGEVEVGVEGSVAGAGRVDGVVEGRDQDEGEQRRWVSPAQRSIYESISTVPTPSALTPLPPPTSPVPSAVPSTTTSTYESISTVPTPSAFTPLAPPTSPVPSAVPSTTTSTSPSTYESISTVPTPSALPPLAPPTSPVPSAVPTPSAFTPLAPPTSPVPSAVPSTTTSTSPSTSRSARSALRVGWRHIRGLGEKTREALQNAHREGPFTSIENVVRRAGLNRAEALHLARAGAFEAFQPGRRKAAWEALRAAGDLLPLAPARVLPFDPRELNDEEMVFLDYIATGISVNGHPMEFLRNRLNAAGVASSRDMVDSYIDGDRIVIAGLVVARQHPETAKGTVFLLLEDEFGYMNIIVTKDLFEKYRETVKFSTFLVIEGRIEREDQVINVIGRRFRELKTREIIARSRDFH